MTNQVALSSKARMQLVEEKSQGDDSLKKLLRSIVTSSKLDTSQVNHFLANCAKGEVIWQQFSAWQEKNQGGSFDSFVLAQS